MDKSAFDDTLLAATVAEVSHTATIHEDPRATVRPLASSPDSAGAGALAQLAAVPSELAEGALAMEETIGQGGMGIVQLAIQRSVGRRVAVKSLRPEMRNPTTALKLLREAWVTGSLDHPNVLPVYDVALDRDGNPVIVLKHVEGVPWSAVMHDAAEARARFGAVDPLQFNLDILMQVCRAAHFAHSRGVVHRDIKPDNVMIGAFGEVYLVDWGIAVSLRQDPSGRLPLAERARGFAGTPCYMCPEMIHPEERGLSERTDIYLLGAVLYEIATGKPPHLADDRDGMLASIERSTPRFDEDVPPGLQRIIERAMQPRAEDRHASAEELRLALQVFLRHRGSERLAAEAQTRLATLSELLRQPEIARDQLYKVFGECRFGFQEALRDWPDNAQAHASLRAAFQKMIDHELAKDDVRAAAALLAEMGDAPKPLRERVEQAVAKHDQHLGELERLRRELDPRIGLTARRIVAVVLGASWTLAPLASLHVDARAAAPAAVVPLGLLALAGILWVLARKGLGQSAFNRRIMLAVVVGVCASVAHVVVSQSLGLPPLTEMVMAMITSGAIIGILAVTLERRLWPAVVPYWAAAIIAGFWREHSPYLLSATNLMLTLYIFAIWKPASSSRRSSSPTPSGS